MDGSDQDAEGRGDGQHTAGSLDGGAMDGDMSFSPELEETAV